MQAASVLLATWLLETPAYGASQHLAYTDAAEAVAAVNTNATCRSSPWLGVTMGCRQILRAVIDELRGGRAAV
jgi:hypothetical protein